MASADEQYDIVLKVRAEGDAELKRLTDELAKLQTESKKTQASVDSLGKTFSGWGQAVKIAAASAATAFASQAISTAINGISDAVRKSIDTMDQLDDAAKKVGISANELSKLQYAAKLSGVETSALESNLARLSKQIANIGDGTSKAASSLKAFGVTAGDTAGKALEKIAAGFAKLPDGVAKTNAAMQIFGKAGAEMIPLLNEGADGLAEMTAEAERLGIAISDEAAAAANEMNDNLDRMSSQVQGVVNDIVSGMIPALSDMVAYFTDTSAAGTDFVSVGEAIGRMLQDVVAWSIKAIGYLRALGEALQGLRSALAAAENLEFGKAGEALSKGWGAAGTAIDQATASANKFRAAMNQTRVDAGKFNPRDFGGIGQRAGTTAIDLGGGGGGGGGGKSKGGGGGSSARTKALSDEEKQAKKTADELARLADQIKALADPLTTYQQQADKIRALQAAGTITREQATIAIAKEWEAYERAAKAAAAYGTAVSQANTALIDTAAIGEAGAEAIEKTNEEMQKAAGLGKKAAKTVADAQKELGEALGQFASDAITNINNLESAVQSLIASLLKLAVQKGLEAIGSSITFAKGGVMSHGRVIPFARGGVVDGPTIFPMATGMGLMGEKGPEAVMPLARDSSGALGVKAPPMNVQVNNYAGADVEARQTPDGGLTLDIIKRAVATDFRRGGNDLSRSVERTYGMSRAQSAF